MMQRESNSVDAEQPDCPDRGGFGFFLVLRARGKGAFMGVRRMTDPSSDIPYRFPVRLTHVREGHNDLILIHQPGGNHHGVQ